MAPRQVILEPQAIEGSNIHPLLGAKSSGICSDQMVAQLGPLVATFYFYTSLCWGSHRLSIKDAAKNVLYLGLFNSSLKPGGSVQGHYPGKSLPLRVTTPGGHECARDA